MPIALHEEAGGRILTVNLTGKLVKEDYESFAPQVARLIEQHGKIRMLVRMHDFHGETLAAFWEDFKFGVKHYAHFERLAVVGDRPWEAWMAEFCKPFTRATVRYFDEARADEAVRWIHEETPPSPKETPKTVDHCVVGIYTTLNEAEAAVRSLEGGGFPVDKVSIIGTHMMDNQHVHGYVTAGDVARWSATGGAWAGGIFGLLIGAAFIWVPGFGPLIVAGPIAAALLGGAEGAIVGAAVTGALGWLVGVGISLEHIHLYEAALKAGKFLVIAHGSADSAKRAHEILAVSRAEQLDLHTPDNV